MLLSIIIPVAAHEDKKLWAALITQFSMLDDCEVLIVGPAIKTQKKSSKLRFVTSDSGRAQAMNSAAKIAKGEWLWFVHADSRINASAVQCLLQKITTAQAQGLFYFGLRFYSPNRLLQQLMRLNSTGVAFRSRLLKSPFGDQAFCIDKKSFNACGRYKTHLAYGEDHSLVWQCHHSGIRVTALPATIQTSASKYQHGGWFKISLLHNWLWLKQWASLVFYEKT